MNNRQTSSIDTSYMILSTKEALHYKKLHNMS